jgi:hypothetical protein
MDSAAMSVSRSASAAGMTAEALAAASTTNANSPTCESSTASSVRWLPRRPTARPSSHRPSAFNATTSTSPRPTCSGAVSTRPSCMLMPTAMKNRPSSRPLNGRMSLSSAWRYSELASSTPARNAPRPMDRPTVCISRATPSTSSSAKPVNSSRTCMRAMKRMAG